MENPCTTEKARRDYVLLRKALDNNDQKAYAELMSLYRDSIYYMLMKIVKNSDDAEDLTLETFGKAFRYLDKYTPQYAFSTWLFRIAVNNSIDYIRHKNNSPQCIEEDLANSGAQLLIDRTPSTTTIPGWKHWIPRLFGSIRQTRRSGESKTGTRSSVLKTCSPS